MAVAAAVQPEPTLTLRDVISCLDTDREEAIRQLYRCEPREEQRWRDEEARCGLYIDSLDAHSTLLDTFIAAVDALLDRLRLPDPELASSAGRGDLRAVKDAIAKLDT